MQLKTSFFSFTLFKKNLTRFWPLWALYALFWFLCLPATIFRRAADVYDGYCDHLLSSMSAQSGLFAVFCFSVLCAMALFSYLFQHRAAVAMHAFPLRRECLFFTNYLSGLTFLVLPMVINLPLILGAEALAGQCNPGSVLVWFTALLCYALFFYSFAVFCAMFTGNLFALPAFYGILSFLPIVLCLLIDSVLRMFVYGYQSAYTLQQVCEVLTPVYKLSLEVAATSRQLPGTEETLYYISGWGWILLYALVGMVLTAAALLVYRRRQVESAGDVVSFRVVRPLFLYGVSVCASLSFGLFLFVLFGDTSSLYAAWQLLACLIVGGFLGYFAAQMLLHKTLRVWRRHWRGFFAFTAVLVVAVATMELDVFGFERTVPNADQVESVYIIDISGPPYDDVSSIMLTDPDAIQQTIQLHQTIVEQREQLQRDLDDPDRGARTQAVTLQDGSLYYPSERNVTFTLTYVMVNGSTLSRSYELWLRETDLDDPQSVASQLQSLVNRPERTDQFFRGWTADQLSDADLWYGSGVSTLPGSADGPSAQAIPTDGSATFSGDDARKIFQAVQEDLDAGRIGTLWLMYSRDYTAVELVATLTFTFRQATQEGRYTYYTFSISPTLRSTATLAALEELGITLTKPNSG